MPNPIYVGPVIERLTTTDSERLRQVAQFLCESASIYPEIEDWWSRRVLPEICAQVQSPRICYVTSIDGNMNGLCILKLGKKSTKLCTLRVSEESRAIGLGTMLLRRVFADAEQYSNGAVHFTMSEHVDEHSGSFFKNAGFSMVGFDKRIGRNAGDELVYSITSHSNDQRCALTNRVRRHVLSPVSSSPVEP